MFGLTFEKLLIIGVIAAFILGPERLPHYAGVLARFVRNVRDYANNAKSRMKEEMGPEFDDVDWRKLDPRQYDPRRIIREALLEDPTPPKAVTAGGPSSSLSQAVTPPAEPAAAAAGTADLLLPPADRAAQPGLLRFDTEAT